MTPSITHAQAATIEAAGGVDSGQDAHIAAVIDLIGRGARHRSVPCRFDRLRRTAVMDARLRAVRGRRLRRRAVRILRDQHVAVVEVDRPLAKLADARENPAPSTPLRSRPTRRRPTPNQGPDRHHPDELRQRSRGMATIELIVTKRGTSPPIVEAPQPCLSHKDRAALNGSQSPATHHRDYRSRRTTRPARRRDPNLVTAHGVGIDIDTTGLLLVTADEKHHRLRSKARVPNALWGRSDTRLPRQNQPPQT
jgi:hypothetical protein